MMLKVGFICVHNSCRSQMAQAIATIFASDAFESYSAGTDLSRGINPDAQTAILRRYEYDMQAKQSVSHINDLPPLDIIITMGCNVHCPTLSSQYRFDWGLDDPSGKGKEAFEFTIDEIEKKVRELKDWIEKAAD